jgi:hypothetical protein
VFFGQASGPCSSYKSKSVMEISVIRTYNLM